MCERGSGKLDAVMSKTIDHQNNQELPLRMHLKLRTCLLLKRPVLHFGQLFLHELQVFMVDKIGLFQRIKLDGHFALTAHQSRCDDDPLELWRLLDCSVKLKVRELTKVYA